MSKLSTDDLLKITDCKFIPLNDKKQPLAKGWQTSTEQFKLNTHSVGLVCGKLSNGVEAIDFDLKYDLTGDLIHRYNKQVNEQCKGLLKRVTIQRTKSGGYHYVYRCSKIEGNQKLAQRPANEEERSTGEKVKVLIETRGEGGQIAVYPSPGYEMIQGKWENIPTITEEERNILIETARSFNEYIEEVRTYTKMEKMKVKGTSPWEDYDNRGDVISLLQSHGWSIVDERGPKVNLLRPGSSTSKYSGNYNRDYNLFSVFSTSTVFEANRGYKPSGVFAMLECNGDFRESAKKLMELGYGEKDTTREVPSRLQDVTISIPTSPEKLEKIQTRDYIANRGTYYDKIIQWRDGKYTMGLETGYPSIDKHFRFKEGNLVIINGFDNVGKSVMIWYMALLSSIKHGWKWLIYTAENDEFSFFRKMIELYWCMEIKGMPDDMINEALDFLEKHFTVIKSSDELYTYKDILTITENELKFGKYHALLIDPYNALDINLNPIKGLNTHEYHYKAISEIKLFTKINKIAVYINMHVVSSAGRGHGKGEIPAPSKSDTEGGNKFANKADEFITIHRQVGNMESYNITELHIRKVKETETGGQVTPYDTPIKLKSRPGVVGFEDIEGYSFIAYIRGKENPPQSLQSNMIPINQLIQQNYQNSNAWISKNEDLDTFFEDNNPF